MAKKNVNLKDSLIMTAMAVEWFILPTKGGVKTLHDEYDPATKTIKTKVVETLCNEE